MNCVTVYANDRRRTTACNSGAGVTLDGDVRHYDGPCDDDDDDLAAQAAVETVPQRPKISDDLKKQTPSFAARPNFSVRMTRRNVLFAERKRLSDYALVFGVTGIALMVLETELNMAGVYDKVSLLSLKYRRKVVTTSQPDYLHNLISV